MSRIGLYRRTQTVEHMINEFTSADPERGDIWLVCFYFMRHLYWHKPRQTLLKSKIEVLPDDQDYKPKCLFELSRLFGRAGNYAEQKRLLTLTLELERQRGDDFQVADTLQSLCSVNRYLKLYEEGIRQAKESLEIFERIGDTQEQANTLIHLTWLLVDEKQLDAAQDAASRAIDLVPDKGQEFIVGQVHRVLGQIHQLKGEKEKAVHHFETVIEIASPPNWHGELLWAHYGLAELFFDRGELDNANTHIERAKSHAVNNPHQLGYAM